MLVCTYRKWTISLSGGVFGRPLPTTIALQSLKALDRQLLLHGPASIWYTIGEGPFFKGKGELKILQLNPNSANEMVASEKRLRRAE